MNMDCYIIDTKRSPRGLGKPKGSLYAITPVNLLAQTLDALLASHLPIDDVFTGCVMPIKEQGGNIARSAVLQSQLPQTTPGLQLNRFCSSGLDALNLLAAQIHTNQMNIAIASGVECMSRMSMLSDGGALIADPSIVIPHAIIPQGISADLLATLYDYSRDELDAYAVLSQQRAKHAMENDYLKSIIEIKNPLGETVLAKDEHPRAHTSHDALRKLKPSFLNFQHFDQLAISKFPHLENINHVHHAGNSSGIVDGASAVLLANEKSIIEHNLQPKAKILGFANTASDPSLLTEPITAIKKALAQTGLSITDIDLWEINEAFASVVLHVIKTLELDIDSVNVNGGAIAYGHPLGATGTILVSTLLDELIRQQKRFGAIAICAASGMATCTIIERIT